MRCDKRLVVLGRGRQQAALAQLGVGNGRWDTCAKGLPGRSRHVPEVGMHFVEHRRPWATFAGPQIA